jgi:DNA/RNA-binding domain of Phe-tRNA-synthetase-like protein
MMKPSTMDHNMINQELFGFVYDAELLPQFPAIVGGVLNIIGLHNGPSSRELQALYQAEQERVKAAGITPTETPSLVAWRSAFRRFGVNPTQYRSAAEALLRRLDKKGDIPSINRLVDIGNLVSIRYAMPVAMVDTRDLASPITVHAATGDESFIELDDQSSVQPDAGEVIFTDAAGTGVARRWCWRQSAQSAARDDTTRLLVTVEGHHAGAHEEVTAALADLSDLLRRFGGADGVEPTIAAGIINAEHPEFPTNCLLI